MDNRNQIQSFARRAFMLAGLKLGAFSMLAGRLYYLQLLGNKKYSNLSNKNSISFIGLEPKRGMILDESLRPLAINTYYYQAMLNKRENKNYIISLQNLFEILNIDKAEQEIIFKRVKKEASNIPSIIFKYLSWEQVSLIEESITSLSGIYINLGQSRLYPYNNLTAHLIGYMGQASEEEKEEMRLNTQIGKGGLEKSYESILKGIEGYKKMEVNSKGLYISELETKNPTPGENITLTINIDLQSYLSETLDNYGSSAAIMNIQNGDILALASLPSFDPNNFTKGISMQNWQELLANPGKPLINKFISLQYPPGSTFKLILLLAALEYGISPEHKVHCSGFIYAGNRKFRCTGVHGTVDMYNAIAFSCNPYMFDVARIIGIDRIENMARRFGMGKLTGINLPSEAKGFVPSKEWKKSKLGQEWSIGDTLNTALGQGYMLTTPVQLLQMISSIANGGKIFTPNLIKSAKDNNFKDIDIKSEYLDVIKIGMNRVVNIAGGTSYNHRIIEENKSFAGKTGTSQILSKKSDSDNFSSWFIPRSKRNHGLFVGYGPVANPKYACSIIVENGGSSSVAARIARNILMKTYEIYGL